MNIRDVENLTVPEAVELFRIGRTKLYELLGSGRIQGIKLGRRTLIRAESVRDFLATLPSTGAADGRRPSPDHPAGKEPC